MCLDSVVRSGLWILQLGLSLVGGCIVGGYACSDAFYYWCFGL